MTQKKTSNCSHSCDEYLLGTNVNFNSVKMLFRNGFLKFEFKTASKLFIFRTSTELLTVTVFMHEKAGC